MESNEKRLEQALYLDDNFHFMFTDNPRFEAVECEALYTFDREFCGEVHRYIVFIDANQRTNSEGGIGYNVGRIMGNIPSTKRGFIDIELAPPRNENEWHLLASVIEEVEPLLNKESNYSGKL